MTPAQARELAAALVSAASDAEAQGFDEIDLQATLAQRFDVELQSLAAAIAAAKGE